MSKKVVVISTSLRANSNSEALAREFVKGAEAAGLYIAQGQKHCLLHRLPGLSKQGALHF